MATWIEVADLQQLPVGGSIEVVVGDKIVALFNVDGKIFALDGVCPHQGGPLGKGALTGCVVTCPWHGWQFDVRDGTHQINRAIVQATLEARVENSRVCVRIDDDKPDDRWPDR